METEQPDSYFSEIEKEMYNVESKLASGSKRIVNAFIDLVTFYILVIITSLFIVFYGLMSDASDLAYDLSYMTLYLFYFTVFELATGKTLGKIITKTRVVKADGTKLDFKAAILRSICRLIPFDPFSFLGKNAEGWHDTISKTRVINDEV